MGGASGLVLGGPRNTWLQTFCRGSHVNVEECFVVREMVDGYERMCIRNHVNAKHGRLGEWWREIKVHGRDKMRKRMWVERLVHDN